MTCPKCGAFTKSGRVSCCAPGGAWFKNCGGARNGNADHKWIEGVTACKGKSRDSLFVPWPIYMKTPTTRHDDNHRLRMSRMRHHRNIREKELLWSRRCLVQHLWRCWEHETSPHVVRGYPGLQNTTTVVQGSRWSATKRCSTKRHRFFSWCWHGKRQSSHRDQQNVCIHVSQHFSKINVRHKVDCYGNQHTRQRVYHHASPHVDDKRSKSLLRGLFSQQHANYLVINHTRMCESIDNHYPYQSFDYSCILVSYLISKIPYMFYKDLKSQSIKELLSIMNLLYLSSYYYNHNTTHVLYYCSNEI